MKVFANLEIVNGIISVPGNEAEGTAPIKWSVFETFDEFHKAYLENPDKEYYILYDERCGITESLFDIDEKSMEDVNDYYSSGCLMAFEYGC